MKGFFIRLALPSEKLELERLQMRASLANEGDRDALLAHPDAIQCRLNKSLEAECSFRSGRARSLGLQRLSQRQDGDSELDGLFVEPRMQRHGIGKALVEHCAEVVRKQGSTAIHVVGNPHATEFYSACGFEVIGTTETRFGPGILMRKPV